MLLKNKKVAILGAGPVGLTIARLLQQQGVEVIVYERDENAQARISGGTLDLHKGSGQDALARAELLKQYYALALPMGRTVADLHGKIILTKKSEQEDQYDNPEINRNDLRKLLLGSLAADSVVWNHKITGLEEHDGKWLLHFSDQATATADFVIAANGGMSSVRKYVTDAVIDYTGTVIIQGEVFQPEVKCAAFLRLCNDTILMVAAQGNLLVANPKNGDHLSYSVIFTKPEGWDLIALDLDIKMFLSTRLPDWNEVYHQLFRATYSFGIWHTRKIPLDQPWTRNRRLPITLIGDAAHIMPPFAGQGVNTGMLDALTLSENLTTGKFESIGDAIVDYEQKMMVYAGEAQLQTSLNERKMLLRDFSFENIYR